jgi:hypothetical protein
VKPGHFTFYSLEAVSMTLEDFATQRRGICIKGLYASPHSLQACATSTQSRINALYADPTALTTWLRSLSWEALEVLLQPESTFRCALDARELGALTCLPINSTSYVAWQPCCLPRRVQPQSRTLPK